MKKSDAQLGVIKKMFKLYSGPFLCIAKPSSKVVEMYDPTSGLIVGHRSEEQCKIWKPTPDVRNSWLAEATEKMPESTLIRFRASYQH